MQTMLATLAVLTVGYFLAYAPFDRLRERFAGRATGGPWTPRLSAWVLTRR